MTACMAVLAADCGVQGTLHGSDMAGRVVAAVQLPGGGTFLGSTPEQLYARAGDCIASEAVAATRARGPPGEQQQTATTTWPS